MLDRRIEPTFGKIEKIELLEPSIRHLDNGLPVFGIDAGTQEVLQVELIFNAGTATADKRLVASSTLNLLTEGTELHSAEQLANAVDFYGAYLQTDAAHDDSSVTLYTLNKHLKKTLSTLAEVYAQPTFPRHELETYLLKSKQELLINEEKVGYLASKEFTGILFGRDHPYGRSASTEHYAEIDRADLQDFHGSFLNDRIAYMLVSGKWTKNTLELLNNEFGQIPRKELTEHGFQVHESSQRQSHIEKKGAVQNAIKIGRVMFNRNHPDFVGVQVLSTVLGGYFGSRLMANIREDKGYTYGVGAGLASMKNSGYLSISTEVGAEVCAAAIDEIFIEIERLRKNLVSTGELELVKNYMLGSILKSIDGPFDIAKRWKSYLRYGLGIDAHHQQINQIKSITPERLKELANTYLQREDLVLVTAGASF